jgi:hypothetical protein
MLVLVDKVVFHPQVHAGSRIGRHDYNFEFFLSLQKSSIYELLKKSSVVVVRRTPRLVQSIQLTSLPGEGPVKRPGDPRKGKEMLAKFSNLICEPLVRIKF